MKPPPDPAIQLDATPRPSRWPKRLLKLCVWSLVLLGVLVGVAPWLLSTGPGNGFLLRVVNRQIPGTFTADRLSVGWFGGLGVSGGELRDPDGGLVVDGLEVRADTLGVMDGLRGSGFGEVVVAMGEMTVEQPAEGATNLERALGLEADDSRESTEPSSAEARGLSEGGVALPVGLGVSFKLTAERVTYTTITAGGTRDETTLADLDAAADLTDATRVTGRATSRLERDGVSGVIDADVALIDAVDDAGVVDWRRGGVDLHAKVLELPIGPLDRLVKGRGVLLASLGERLSAEVSAAGTLAAPEATLAVRSPLLTVDASLQRQGDAVEIEPDAALVWRLTPDAFARLQGQDAAGAVLTESVDVRVPFEALRLPIQAAGVAVEEASGRVEATWSPVSIVMSDGRTVTLRGGSLRADTEAVGRRVSVALATDASVSAENTDQEPTEDRVLLTMAVLDLMASEATGEEVGVGFDLELERLPVALIEALAAVEVPGGGLPRWLGPELSLDAEVRLPVGTGGRVQASGRVRSAGLSGPFALSIQPNGLAGDLSTPEPMMLRLERDVLLDTMGAEAWFAWPVGIRESMEPALTLRDVRWEVLPSAPPQDGEALVADWEAMLARLDPVQTRGQIELTLPSLQLQDHRRDRPLPELRGLRASVAVSELSRPIEAVLGVNFDGPVLPESPKVVDGGVTMRVTASDLMNPRGVFAPQQGAYELMLRGTAVPSSVVDAFAGQEGKLAATLGPAIEPEVTARVRPGIDATLEIDVVSTHAVGAVLLSEDLSDDMWRPELQEDPRFTLSISRGAVESWMGRLHPVFADVVRSSPEAPARLSLDRSSFELSDQGFFDLEGIRAQATLDLGRLELERQGWLRQGVIGVVRQLFPEFRRDRAGATYVASFSPMRIAIEDGVVQTSELWLSADDMGLGFAGSVDLNTNRIDMGVGILGATFIAAGSDFEKALEPLRIYELPVRGTIAEPKIEFDKFLGQVAAAYGQRELQRNADKLGDWGRILGVLGESVVAAALQWENTRAWTPSGDAQAFAVGIADPEPAEEAGDDSAAEAAPPEPAEDEPEEEIDEVDEVLRGILDIIGRQRDR
ncbi:MAG: hypothetical protein AAF328_01550 [Planctomycetota bacterium]